MEFSCRELNNCFACVNDESRSCVWVEGASVTFPCRDGLLDVELFDSRHILETTMDCAKYNHTQPYLLTGELGGKLYDISGWILCVGLLVLFVVLGIKYIASNYRKSFVPSFDTREDNEWIELIPLPVGE